MVKSEPSHQMNVFLLKTRGLIFPDSPVSHYCQKKPN